MTKFKWLMERRSNPGLTTISKNNIYKQQSNNWGNQCDFAVTVIPKVYELNNKCLNPDYQPIPKPLPYLPIASVIEIWVREA